MEHPEGAGNEGAVREDAVHDGSSGRSSDNVVRMGPSENCRRGHQGAGHTVPAHEDHLHVMVGIDDDSCLSLMPSLTAIGLYFNHLPDCRACCLVCQRLFVWTSAVQVSSLECDTDSYWSEGACWGA